MSTNLETLSVLLADAANTVAADNEIPTVLAAADVVWGCLGYKGKHCVINGAEVVERPESVSCIGPLIPLDMLWPGLEIVAALRLDTATLRLELARDPRLRPMAGDALADELG